MPSLFGRLGKYPPSLEIDPRENRLTEAFAGVLEHVDKLAAGLVAEWTGFDGDVGGHVWVRTQRPTLSGNFVDLELAFGAPTAPDRRVWIEVKHGAGLHANQLKNYLADLEKETQARSDVVVLAPRDSMPPTGGVAPSVEWQELGRLVARWAKRPETASAERWILGEFLDYLKEEGLADDEALTPAHAFALAARPGADRAVARVIEVADHIVMRDWGRRRDFSKRGNNPAYGPGWWSTHDITDTGAPADWRKCWFEWTLRADEFRPDGRDAYAFFAGATFQSAKDSPLNVAGNGEWLAAVGAAGFERVQAWYWRLWRPLYPEQLMAETSLDAQGRRLGAWVVKCFRELGALPPPV